MCASPKIQTRPGKHGQPIPPWQSALIRPTPRGSIVILPPQPEKGRGRAARAQHPTLPILLPFCSVLDASLSPPPFGFRHSRYRGAQGELLVFCGSIGTVSTSSLWLLPTRRSETRCEGDCCARLQVGVSVSLF